MTRRDGFTLVELLIAVALLSVVVIAVTQSFMVQNRTYTVIEQSTEAQQNGRAIADLLEREARMTGFMVAEAGSVCGIDLTTAADTLFVTDAAAIAIDPDNDGVPDLTAPSLGARLNAYVSALGLQVLNVDQVVLDGDPYYDTNGDGVEDSDFRVGGGAIVFDPNDPTRGTACGVVDAVAPALNTLQVDFMTQTAAIPPGTQVRIVPAHVYQLNTQMQLLRDGAPMADDVEDLQIAYFFDVDGNGKLTSASENPGASGVASYVSSNWNHETLRELRINVVTRTREADPSDQDGAAPIFQTTENRAAPAAGAAAIDGYRRRVQSFAVRPRNVGGRG